MKPGSLRRIAAVAVAASLVALIAAPALAQAPAPPAPTPNKGDTAWMMTASALVLLMTIPGLALFYGGLVRTKNMLSMLMQVFSIVCLVIMLWVIYGYSLAFSEGGAINAFVGGFSKAFLAGITPDTTAETFSDGVVIPEYVYICFQMTFAAITRADRRRDGRAHEVLGHRAVHSAVGDLRLFPDRAHGLVLGGPGCGRWPRPRQSPPLGRRGQEGSGSGLAAVQANAGLVFQWGALDFAGGTVVHINSGIAGLVGALILGKRVGFGREAMPPHSLTMTLIGASLLWVGWFGFNAGSALEANGTAALAMINTFVATAAAALAWMVAERVAKGKPSLLGGASGAVAGLVAVTPASGFAGPMGAIVLGIVAGVVCLFFCSAIKNALGYDDALDVFGVHCIGGIIGAIGTGILAAPRSAAPACSTTRPARSATTTWSRR